MLYARLRREAGYITVPVLLIVTGFPIRAAFQSASFDFSANYFQTGPSTVVPAMQLPQGGPWLPYSFSITVYTDNANDFANAALTTCGGGTGCPQNLLKSGAQFNFVTPIPDLATFATKFPFGTYTITLSNPGSFSAMYNYTQNLYPTDIPQFTPATFNALNGLNPSHPLTLQFNSFTPNPAASSSNVFLNIFNFSSTGFQAIENPSSTTSIFMPANSLLPNTTYFWYLAFSNSIDSQTFLTETTGQFTTGPASSGITTDTVKNISPAWKPIRSIGISAAYGLPAVIPGCGQENEPTCEPTGDFVISSPLTTTGYYTMLDSDGQTVSDYIVFGNTGPGGTGEIKFYSDPTLPQTIPPGTNMGVLCTEVSGQGCAGAFNLTTTSGTTFSVLAGSDDELVFDPLGLSVDSSDEIEFLGITGAENTCSYLFDPYEFLLFAPFELYVDPGCVAPGLVVHTTAGNSHI
jgi:hypothetical protein